MGDTEETPLKKKDNGGSGTFSSSVAIIFSCIGCAVGTGNIWRFPRIVAASSGQGGALVFILIWLLFLFIWSIPVLLIEYSSGRYTTKGVVQTFLHFLGPKFTWCSMWITLINLFISGYYLVIVGWCMYYCVYFIINPLPATYDESTQIFQSFAEESYLPILLMFISVVFSGLAIIKGVKTLELVNLVLTPSLLVILILIFMWSLSRDNAFRGIAFLFKPDWGSFLEPSVWVNAASQNAFDTSAGTGQFVAYAAYMTRDQSIVKYSLAIPIVNNLVSLLCGMTTFSTAFSSLSATQPNITDADILGILQTSGPGGTGTAFMWLPVLLQTAGTFGRVIAVFMFLAMVFAGITSSIAYTETFVHPLDDFKVPRKYGVPLTMTIQFLLGIGSATNLNFLTNQDMTWGYGLLIIGLMLQAMVITYGVNTYREKVINAYGPNDLKAPKLWGWIVKYIAPAETSAVLLWWIVGNIINDPNEDGSHWYEISKYSVMSVLLQWAIVFGVILLLNFLLLRWKKAKMFLMTFTPGMEPLDDGGQVQLQENTSEENTDKVRLQNNQDKIQMDN